MERVPANGGALVASRAAALEVPLAAIVLVFCGRCGHVANAAFDARLAGRPTVSDHPRLERIGEPLAFLAAMRRRLSHAPPTTLTFEVPNFRHVLQAGALWELEYESCSYFTPSSLGAALAGAAFTVYDVVEEHGGRLLRGRAQAGSACGAPRPPAAPACEVDGLQRYVDAFAGYYRERIAWWQRRLAELAVGGTRAVVWGAGAQSTSFLNAVGAEACIDLVVDVDPRRCGKFVPGSGQAIVAPADLRALRPPAIVVVDPSGREAARRAIEALGLEALLL